MLARQYPLHNNTDNPVISKSSLLPVMPLSTEVVISGIA
jgi:hypothetical protein